MIDRSGGFDYDNFYSQMVNKFPSGSKFAEIGIYKGGSLDYLCEIIRQSGKDIEVIGVDNFSESYDGSDTENLATMRLAPWLNNILTLVKGDSSKTASNYVDETFDFVFIDACHEYESVVADIKAWYPKVKQRGIIGGHDYHEKFAGVKKAVHEIFGEKIGINGVCWFINK